MPVPFGFSVGDFVAVLTLFKELALALQDRGGSSDYHKTVVDLETIVAILINSIRGQAHRTYNDVRQFLSSIERFNHELGPRGARGFHGGTFAKIKWSQCVATKVKELRETVHLQTANIQTLLNLLIQHNQNSDRDLFKSIFAKHSAAIESLTIHVKSIEMALHQNSKVAEERVVGASHYTSKSSEPKIDRSCTQNRDDQDRKASRASGVSSHVDAAFAEQTCPINLIRDLQDKPSITNDVQELDQTTGTGPRHKNHASTSNSAPLNGGPRLSIPVWLPQVSMADIFLAVFKLLSSKAGFILQHLIKLLLAFRNEVLFSLPHLLLYLKFLRQIPRAMSLVLDENIRFEDALGRIQSLQYQQFRHWTVFEACLRCTFKNTPGMQKVLQGKFVLTCPGAPGEVLDATNWEIHASPGMVVTMSISISTILTPSGRCPRGCIAERTALSSSEARCMECDLTFSVRSPPQTDVLRTMKFIGTRSKPIALREIRKRKRSENISIKSKEQRKRERRESAASRLEAQLNIDRAEVSNLMRYESFHEEQEDHRLEIQEITQFKRVHIVEDAVLKWTWVFCDSCHPWYWGWYVELPELRSEWKTVKFWEAISLASVDQIVEDEIMKLRRLWQNSALAEIRGRELAFRFSQETPPAPSLLGRTYTLTYKGSLSFSESQLLVLKIPFIHLLATKPLTPSQIRQFLRAPKVECDQLLAIFARDFHADSHKKELQNISYKELDVWGFPYHKQSIRQAAINRSIQAFDALQIDLHDELWQLLLPVEQRGKSICLSKRNLA